MTANLNYIEHFRILASPNTGLILISVLSALIGVPIGITN